MSKMTPLTFSGNTCAYVGIYGNITIVLFKMLLFEQRKNVQQGCIVINDNLALYVLCLGCSVGLPGGVTGMARSAGIGPSQNSTLYCH